MQWKGTSSSWNHWGRISGGRRQKNLAWDFLMDFCCLHREYWSISSFPLLPSCLPSGRHFSMNSSPFQKGNAVSDEHAHPFPTPATYPHFLLALHESDLPGKCEHPWVQSCLQIQMWSDPSSARCPQSVHSPPGAPCTRRRLLTWKWGQKCSHQLYSHI